MLRRRGPLWGAGPAGCPQRPSPERQPRVPRRTRGRLPAPAGPHRGASNSITRQGTSGRGVGPWAVIQRSTVFAGGMAPRRPCSRLAREERDAVLQQRRGEVCPGGGQQFHTGIEAYSEFVRVASAENQIIAPGVEGDQIRSQRQRRTNLLIQDLLEQQPADCQVRVCEILMPDTQLFGDPVRPAPQAPGLRGSGSPTPFS